MSTWSDLKQVGRILLAALLVGCTNVQPVTVAPSTPTATYPPTLAPLASASSAVSPPPQSTSTPTWKVERTDSVESPNKTWVAVTAVVSSESTGQQIATLKVERSDRSVTWVAEEVRITGLFFDLALPLQWSSNGLFLFYTHLPARFDGCFGAGDSNGSDLWRLNLQTGQTKELTPKSGNWLALSPDEKTLAYLSYTPVQIVLRDLESGWERSADLELQSRYPNLPTHASNLVWSPDGKLLVFTLEINVCDETKEASHSIIRVDADALSQRTLISEDPRLFKSVAWLTIRQITLQDRDSGLWLMNVDTGQVVQAP